MNFPPRPNLIDSSITNPSKEFVRDTYKVCFAILFFILTYVVLFAIGATLALLAAYMGYWLVINHPRFFTIMIGLALCLFGCFIIYFLVKFIGSKNNHDISHLPEIKSTDEPEIFKFIQKVVNEVGSDFPKKIYLSNEVNAYVFYNSSFLSLFFPVKKNLTIGLGLINSINLSEFKAILAHEFGHFSQKSMKLGSYIYYVNRVIHDMLYDNDSFEESISKVSESNGYLSIAGALTFMVVRGIQFILKLVYKPINTMYLSLSRQMEFHADAVAASVTGGNHLVTSLRRLEMSDVCFNAMMSNYNEWGFNNFKSSNIYHNHKTVQKHYASDHEMAFVNNNIDVSDFSHQESRIKIKDQWASHPTLEQRTKKLNDLNLVTEPIHDSPWNLFVNPSMTQEKFTESLFGNLSKDNNIQKLDNEEFKQKYFESYSKFDLPKEYCGFFDNYFPIDIEFDEIENHKNNSTQKNPITKKEIKKLKDGQSIYNDLNMLQFIIDGNSEIKSFDFDGKKYKSKEAKEIYKILEKDSKELAAKYRNTSKNTFVYFYALAKNINKGEEYKRKYNELVSGFAKYEDDYELYNSIQTELNPIYQGNIPIPIAENLNKNVKELDVKFKQLILAKISLNELEQDDFALYLNQKRNYFSVDTFNDRNLEILITALNNFINQQNLRLTKLKKNFLEYQLTLNKNY